MTNVATLLQRRAARKTRPVHYEELLLEPVADGAAKAKTVHGCYVGWEKDHSVARRFYVAGMEWLKNTTGLTQADVTYHRTDADREILKKTNWHQMVDPSKHWKTALGRPQVRHAFSHEPMPFAKAAQVLMACELALDEVVFKKNRTGTTRPPGFLSAEEIHGYMGIYPACCNIDDFSVDYLKEVRGLYPNALVQLCNASAQRTGQVIEDMTRAACVSHDTATAVHAYATANFHVPSVLGPVRAEPGTFLGNGNASESEQLDLC